MPVMSVMRRRSEQQQSVAASRDRLRQTPPQRVFAIGARGGADAVVRFVDDREIPGRTLEILEYPLLFGEIQRRKAQSDRIERIAAKLELSPLRLQRRRIGDRH